MAHYQISTNNKRHLVDVKIDNKEGRPIQIVGFDPLKYNTEYFNRLCLEKGIQTYQFGCPLTPKKLNLVIFDVEKGYSDKPKTFTIKSIKTEPIEFRELDVDYLTSKFIEFAQDFAEKAGYLTAGTYSDKDNLFKINYVNRILDERGNKSPTPARIHKTEKYIEVSREWLVNLSIPIRLQMLFHEYSHLFLNKNPSDESEADINGVNLFLALGYPFVESVYAYTKVFGDNPKTKGRLNNIINALEKRRHTR